MNFSLTGFVVLVLFVIPGAMWAGHIRGQSQSRKLNATELIIQSVGFSLGVHILLSVLLMGILLALGARAEPAFELLGGGAERIGSLTLLQQWILSLGASIYVLVACASAYGLAKFHFFIAKKRETPKERPVWLNFFGSRDANFVKVWLNDGQAYIGLVKYFPLDYESIHSDSRDLVLTDVLRVKVDGTIENPAPGIRPGEKVDVLLKTADVKSIELLRAPSDEG